MKKIVCLIFTLGLLASTSFAANLADVLTSTKLSNQVSGIYWANESGAGDDATSYVLSTGHAQGNKAYASGNFVSEIYTVDIAGDKFASTDLINAEPAFDSTAFSDWTAL
ncbi:MAG: hypothetical protein L3J57_08985 [Desulfuromusa sp.]|nr:hypothetical protein [Desulfuromusa sp.]